jgi:hypothetical protein
MKKNLIISAAFIIVVAGCVTYFFLRPHISSAQIPGANNPVLPASSLPDYLGTASEVFGNNPTGTTLSIGTSQGTVAVNNFYASDPPVDLSQYIVIKITQNYLVDYDPTDSSFWIGVSGMPFSNWQNIAEQDFLATLGISQSDACKLSVVEGVIYSADNPDDGMSFPLSFCASSTFTE